METRDIADALFKIVLESGHVHHYTIEKMVSAELDQHEFVRAVEHNHMMPLFEDVCKMTLRFAAVYAKYGVTGMALEKSLARMFKQVLSILHDFGHKDVWNDYFQSEWNRMRTDLVPTLRAKYPELWKAIEQPEQVHA